MHAVAACKVSLADGEVFTRFQQLEREQGGGMGYLSSHPPSAEHREPSVPAG